MLRKSHKIAEARLAQVRALIHEASSAGREDIRAIAARFLEIEFSDAGSSDPANQTFLLGSAACGCEPQKEDGPNRSQSETALLTEHNDNRIII